MKNYSWLKVDTASIMFTCLSTKKWGRTFRLAAVMKDEEINPVILKKAVTDLIPRYPSIHSQLKKGFFWNYLECTSTLPEIREEFTRQVMPITYRNDGHPDFRIVYHKRRIAIECAHHIGDGKAVSEYFNALLERYVELCSNPDSKYIPEAPTAEELRNDFNKYYQKGGEKAQDDETPAHQLEGDIESDFIQLVFALMSADELHQKAKEKNLSITEFLASVLILGTIRNGKTPIDKPISIAIPVNLRRFFESESMRNFTIQSKIDFLPGGRTDCTFDEICDEIRGQLKKRLTVDELQKTLNKFGSLANNPVIKVVPNFIKLPVLRSSQASAHGNSTTILTNLGNYNPSPALKEKIERFDFVNGDTSGYGLISTCSVASVNDILTLCFSICSHDTSWAKECIRVLSQQGVNIRVETSHGNGECE